MKTIRLILALSCVVCSVKWAAAAPKRYAALLRDGTQFSGDKLTNIDQPAATLDGKPLFQNGNAVRFLRDTTRIARLQDAHIEFTNGDVLTGTVLQWKSRSLDGTPAHFVVQPSCGEFEAAANPSHHVRIRQSCVQRIVSSGRSARRFQPGRVQLADGRRVTARAIRFRQDGARVLTSDGVLNVPFEELAEAHFLGARIVEGVTDDARWSAIFPEQILLRLRTTYGAALTFPQSMMTRDLKPPRRTRKSQHGQNVTFFAVQPAWALDAISVPEESVVSRSYRDYDEVPLSLLPVRAVRQEHTLHRWPWRRNASVTGGPLASSGLQADLGIGTHSFCAITFELPQAAIDLTSYVGLDRTVGDGGCVECRLHRDLAQGPLLWTSGFLRGSDGPQRIGPLPLKAAKQLTLVTDFGHEGRPEGTDPYDIRDHVSWILPTVRIKTLAEKTDNLVFWLPQLQGWQIENAPKHQLRLRPVWNQDRERWEMALLLRGDAQLNQQDVLQLSQRVKISLLNAWLPVVARHDGQGKASYEISVTVNGQPCGSTMNGNLPLEKARPNADSRVWIFHELADKETDIAVIIKPLGKKKEKYAAILFDEISLQPLIRGLQSGQPIKPDVSLASLSPTMHTIKHENVRLTDGKMSDGRPLAIRGYPMAAGFAVPVGTEITYQLDPAWQRFVAVIGLSDGWKGAGPYQILLDDAERPHWSSGTESFGRNTPAQQIDVPIPAGHKSITLRLLGSESFGAWAHAGFITQ